MNNHRHLSKLSVKVECLGLKIRRLETPSTWLVYIVSLQEYKGYKAGLFGMGDSDVEEEEEDEEEEKFVQVL